MPGSCPAGTCLPLSGRWLGVSRDGGSVPGSIGHPPVTLCSVTAPSYEGAKAPARIPYAGTARRKPSPRGEGGSPQGLTDVGPIGFPGSPIKRTGSPPHPAPSGPPSPGRRGLWLVLHRQPLPPLIRPLCGHLPMRGRLFLCPGRVSVGFYCSNFATWRARQAAPLQSKAPSRRDYCLISSMTKHSKMSPSLMSLN